MALLKTNEKQVAQPYHVMLVDDSVVIRGMYTKLFENDNTIKIIASVGNGQMAIDTLKRNNVDVIILDIEMPIMDGITALPELLKIDPSVQILMSSTLTKRNAEISMAALQLGAKDYLTKPSTTGEMTGADQFKRELVEKTKVLAAKRRKNKGMAMPDPALVPQRKTFAAEKVLGIQPGQREIALRKASTYKPEILAVGSSTGGPNALFGFFKALDKGINVPVVVTQHMPPNFTAILAEHIHKTTGWDCVEAKNGDVLAQNKIFIAPGDFHMTIADEAGKKVIHLNQDAPENFCRPSVDPMLRSLIPLYGPRVLMVMLTGMGSDGLPGSRKIVEAGGTVIAQDEASSVVWGMPGAVAGAGICSAVLPLDDLAGYVAKFIRGQR